MLSVDCVNTPRAAIDVSATATCTPPTITSVLFTPNPAAASEDLIALPTAIDADGDDVTFSYTWKVNGFTRGGDSDTLAGGLFGRGDTIILEIVPTDDQGDDENRHAANHQPAFPRS